MFWGAVWGIVEATLGYVLHMMNFSIGWIIWFPLAFLFMNNVYKDTGKLSSILYTCSIASAVKLMNLLLPVRIDKVINPAVSILFEGIVLFITFKIVEKSREKFNYGFPWVLSICIGWKVLYVLYLLTVPSWMVSISPIRGIEPFVKFFIAESVVNALVIFCFIKAAEKLRASGYKGKRLNLKNLSRYAFQPAVSFSVLVLALIIQLVL